VRKLILLAFLSLGTVLAAAQQYDLVLEGGRVIDPETSLDAIRNVGIRDGKIVRISSEPLAGRRVIHAMGLIVSPGFIDLHQHGQEPASQRVKAFDGVTTALEMEIGVPDIAQFLKFKEGHSIIHYGTTASHCAARALVFGAPLPPETFTPDAAVTEILPKSGPATNDPATPEQIQKIEGRLRDEIDAGALGVGMGIQYTPGATRLEVIDMFRLAAERKLPVYTHMRSAGRIEPGSAIEAVEEVIGAAAISGASLHIVHINSTCLRDAIECISLVAGARARGLDVTTEAYPYVAGMTAINSEVFSPGWRERQGIDYGNLVLPDTGEHLTKERFDELHNSSKSQPVLIFSNTQDVVDTVIVNPLVMIASDGAPGHPRNAGTYSRVLAQYVREKKTITLMEAIRKMSLMPAQMLERSTPAAKRKGRLQEGADADIVVFDPQTIADRATFDKPMEPSVGVRYELVAGTLLIEDGKLVPDVYPGLAILGPGKLPQVVEADSLPPFPSDYTMPASGQVTVLAEGGLTFKMKINGQGPFPTVFDTGGVNIVSTTFAKRLGLKIEEAPVRFGAIGGETTAHTAHVNTMTIGDLVVRDQTFYVLDIPSDSGDPTIIVGWELMRRFAIRVDFEHNQLTFFDGPHFRYTGTGASVPLIMHKDSNGVEIRAEVNGVSGFFTLDTGNQIGLFLNSSFVQEHNLVAALGAHYRGYNGRGLGGPAPEAWFTRLRSLRIGDLKIADPVVRLQSQPDVSNANAGNIGQSILGRFTLTLDCMRRVMYLEKNTNWDKPEVFNRAGLILDFVDGVDTVMTVLPGSPGEAAGLKPHDKITAINGQPPADDPNDPIFVQPAGTVLHITVRRDGALHVYDVTLRDVL
jgi:N-acyl-D-aspartate/D-glutamate deacylase